jgi:hypothetical protein
MQSVEAMSERTRYWLSLDTQVRALAERLLQRFAVTVGDLAASATHHHAKPGGLDRQSIKAPLSLAGVPELTRSCPLRPSQKQNFFGAQRSFLPTPWALGDRGPSSARSSRYQLGILGRHKIFFEVGPNFCRLDGHQIRYERRWSRVNDAVRWRRSRRSP